jgi:ABC-2 type transport system permease protein
MNAVSELAVAEQAPRERRTTSLVLHEARYDAIAFLRNGQARFATIVLPLMFLVIFVSVFGNQHIGPEHVRAATYYVPGIAALAVISASFTNLVIGVVAQRELGILKRRRATPVPAWVLIAGRSLTAVATSLAVLAVVLAVGVLAFGVHLRAAAVPGLVLTATVGAAAFACIGYAAVTSIRSSESAQPVVLALTLPLYFVSGVFVPSIRLPHWLHSLAVVFPVEHLANGLHRAFDPATTGAAIGWRDLAVVAAWGLGGLALAVRRFVWTPQSGGH